MSKSLINLNNNKYVLPIIHSAYWDKLTYEHKKSNIIPEHVLSEYSKLSDIWLVYLNIIQISN